MLGGESRRAVWLQEEDYHGVQSLGTKSRRSGQHHSIHSDTNQRKATGPRLQRRLAPSRTLRKRRYLALGTLAAAILPTSVLAQSCVSLLHSTQCAAFNASSISTNSNMTGMFPFLATVTDTVSFDQGIQSYINGSYTQQRYQQLLGCSAFDSSHAPDYYARYTASVLCNAIVQNSIDACSLSGLATTPLCASTCADYAETEEAIASSSLCGTTSSNAANQIRADFTNCALPADSLSGACIEGYTNEPDNCGFANNTAGLCSHCSANAANGTDSCCVFSGSESRCEGVVLPIFATSSLTAHFTPSATSSPSSTAAVTGAAVHKGLSGGQIAGIVVGSVLGAFLLLALLILGCLLLKRRRNRASPMSSPNKIPQSRVAPAVGMHDGAGRSQRDFVEALPGGRVARMAAIEGESSPATNKFSSEEDTPLSQRTPGTAAPLPDRRGSMLGMRGLDGEQYSSPDGSAQSEQLSYFKDYYSQDEIRPGDLVSTLWAYQPRANDEFDLDRGDMLKVVGIWDDGWATGVRVRMNAEDWRDDSRAHRDSATDNSNSAESSPAPDSEVKAFPLVCICLPQYWRKTIEGETTEEFTSGRDS